MSQTLYADLAGFSQTLRDYQLDILDDSMDFIAGLVPHTGVEGRRLYACPTGTGKGTAQLAILKRLRQEGHDAWIFTPSLDVLRGALQRCGIPQEEIDKSNPERLAELGRLIYVTTPLRYQNGTLKGDWGMPDVVIYDEAHHAVEDNEVSGTLFALAPDAKWIGFTATPYRGTPAGTKDLREAWGEPILVMDIPEAIEAGFMARPTFKVVPLVDDDTIKVVNGKFQTKAAGKKVKDRLDALCDVIEGVFGEETQSDHSIVVTVPSTDAAGAVVGNLLERGIGAKLVVGTTPAAQRADAYRLCKLGYDVIVSVKVLTEGVDLPFLDVLIDARPTTSPVDFIQRIGRIMRPKEDGRRPQYICVCRNMERHAYLLGGAVPREAIKQAQEAFEKPTKRDGYRSLGFEAMARFKRIPVPLDGGIRGSMFNVHSIDGDGIKTEWCVLTSPLSEAAVVARRETRITINDETGEREYANGKWVQVGMPDDLSGFATSQQHGSLSKKQKQWWERAARRYGLDCDAADDLKRRQFQALPVLSDLKTNILNLGKE